MSVNTENGSAQGQTTVLEKESVYASLFDKINLTPATSLGDINAFLDDAALSDAPAGERLTAAMQVFMDCIRKSGQPVEKLDKTLIDHHIAELDFQISRQLDAVMHHAEFQKVESLWRGLKQLVDNTDYRQNVKTEILDVSKDDLRQDFEDAPELIQSGLYWHTYIRATFMGMYGVDSPLPTAYLDDITQRREGHDALQGFLDIFSHRILTQFYRIWRKYSYPATFEPGGTDSISQSLLGLVGLGIPGTANHIATPVSRFLALLGVLQQPGKTQEGIQALVSLLAPDTTVTVSPYCLRPVEVSQPLGFYGDDDFLLDGNTPLGDEAMDASSQLLIALSTDNEQESQGWKPDGLLYQDFLVMLRVYLGWRFKAKITLTTLTRLLAVPPLGEGSFWLGMNGVLGAEEGAFADDIPQTFTTELGYYTGLQPATPQQGNRRVTYKFD